MQQLGARAAQAGGGAAPVRRTPFPPFTGGAGTPPTPSSGGAELADVHAGAQLLRLPIVEGAPAEGPAMRECCWGLHVDAHRLTACRGL